MADNTFLAPLSPIQRSTSSDRLLVFQKNEYQIYNKFSPYYQAGGDIGPNQPYVYTKLTDSNFQKNLTRYDTQVFPVGSMARDVIRMTKFSVSGTGVLYLGKQLLLQQQNAFNETRVYNPLSLLKATAKPGSLGLFDRPQRHVETSGGLLNFFVDSLLDTFGVSTKDANKSRIEGTATGRDGNDPYSNYADKRGGAKYGLIRYSTAAAATSNFSQIWASNSSKNNASSGGFLQRLASGLVEKLRTMIPSTNPMGAFGGKATDTWIYRPEYKNNKEGIYYTFLRDAAGLLKTTQYNQPQEFYNDAYSRTGRSSGGSKPYGDVGPSYYHKYYPSETDTGDKSKEYAPKQKIQQDRVGSGNNIKDTYARMMSAMKSYSETDGGGQFRSSAERYTANPVIGINNKNNYNSIPGGGNGSAPTLVNKSSITEGPFLKTLKDNQILNDIRIDNRGFSKAATKFSEFGTPDTYNSLDVIQDTGTGNWPRELLLQNSLQSKDLIFFYFYDLINKIYIPFRATLGSIQDQHSPDWEDIKYMGRADKLYIYKGFSRDVSFSFKVYANSIDELVPMWKRVNYMAGLTRPSKYTDRAYETAGSNYQSNQMQSQVTGVNTDGRTAMSPYVVRENRETTGNESGFIYPPMIEFRIGDMYVDQPAILRSVNITVPEDAVWETIQSDSYEYIYGVDKILKKDAYSRQLPTIIDVSIQLSIIEKEKSIVGGNYFGPSEGWENIIT